MQLQQIQYSRPLVPQFFEGAKHDDLKWTINYLLTLLEKPEVDEEAKSNENIANGYSERINKLLSIPKKNREELSPEMQELLAVTAPLKGVVPEWDLNGDMCRTEALKEKYGY